MVYMTGNPGILHCSLCGEEGDPLEYARTDVQLLSGSTVIQSVSVRVPKGKGLGTIRFPQVPPGIYTFRATGIIQPFTIYVSRDTDGDGLSDYFETLKSLTDPNNPDTDGDGLTDGEECLVYHTNPLKVDTDGDGLSDYDEIHIYHTDPLNPDTDGDGIRDGLEIANGTDPLVSDAEVDSDGDGLSNALEYGRYHTDPYKADTDDDGLSDFWEVMNSTNPLQYTYQVDYYGVKYYFERTEFPAAPEVSAWDNPDNIDIECVLTQIHPGNSAMVWSFSGTPTQGATFSFEDYPRFAPKISFYYQSSSPFMIEVGCKAFGDDTIYPVRLVPGATDTIGAGSAEFGLGAWADDGNRYWCVRDLFMDIRKIKDELLLEQVTYFKVYGTVKLDRLGAIFYGDADNDCIPDVVETFFGLDPQDAADAGQDLDNDGISNYHEWLLSSNLNDVDSDGDGLSDYDEVFIHHTNPASSDSDGDGLDDYWEITNFGNQDQLPGDDYNNDGLTNLEKSIIKPDPQRSYLPDDSIPLLFYDFYNKNY